MRKLEGEWCLIFVSVVSVDTTTMGLLRLPAIRFRKETTRRFLFPFLSYPSFPPEAGKRANEGYDRVDE